MDIVLRAAVMFIFLFGLLRLMGKRELGQMTPFELVVIIVMGDLIQQAVTQADTSITGAILAVGTFAFLAILLSWVSWRFPASRRLLDGKPRIVVRGGVVDREALVRDRMTVDEIEAEMRMAGIARLSMVAWAILETNGKISFIRRDDGPLHSGGEDTGTL
jgi:uncharacterized membrane protein YcaP (DUF421 family)